MNLRFSFVAFVVIATLGIAARVHAGELEKLVEQADMGYRGSSAAAVIAMEVKTKSYSRSYRIVMWTDDRKDKDRTLVKILGPSLWRGFGTLKIGNALKLYDPKSNHVTVVSNSMLGDSWMGSHFSNDDLVKETRLAEDFALALDKKWQEGAAVHYRVVLSPKPTAPVPWDKIVYELAMEGGAVWPVKVEYYRKAGSKTPERTTSFTSLRQLGGRRLPAVMTVQLANKPGEYTRIEYQRLEFGVRIPDSKFSEQALRK